jgi:hypothetical protein
MKKNRHKHPRRQICTSRNNVSIDAFNALSMFDNKVATCVHSSLKQTMIQNDDLRVACCLFIPEETKDMGTEESIEKVCAFLTNDWVHEGRAKDINKLQTRVSMCEAILVKMEGYSERDTNGVFGGDYLCYTVSVWLSCHARLWLQLESGGEASNYANPSCRFAITPNLLPECKSKLINLRFNGAVEVTAKEDMMTHLLNKGLPKRCQIRELSRFMREYMSSNPELCIMVNRMMLLSLCGLYPHCRKHAPFWAMKLLICRLHYTNTPMLHEGQTVWLFVIREYIIYAVRNIPPLRSYLCKHIKWSKFENYIISSMDTIRCLWSTAFGNTGHSDSLETQLGAINKFFSLANLSLRDRIQQLRLEYCRCMVSQNTTALTISRLVKLITTIVDKHLSFIAQGDGSQHQHCGAPNNSIDLLQLHKTAFSVLDAYGADNDMMQRLVGIGLTPPEMDIIASLMRMIQCKDNIANAGVLVNKLLSTSIQNTIIFQHELRQTLIKSNVMLVSLPTHVKAQQLKSISTNEMNPPTITSSVCMGMAIFCLSCREMKSMVVPHKPHLDSLSDRCNKSIMHHATTQPNKHQTNHTNHGSTKIIVDADTNTLHCDNMCSEDTEQAQAQLLINKPNTIESRVTKMYCSTDSIRAVNLIGKALFIHNQIYILCVNCARITTYNNNCMNLCSLCDTMDQMKHGNKRCSVCDTNLSNQQNDIVVSPPLKGDIVQVVVVCDECKQHLVTHNKNKHNQNNQTNHTNHTNHTIPSIQQCIKLVEESKMKERISSIHRETKRMRRHV